MTELEKAGLYEEYAVKVKRYIYGKTNDAYLAEDLTSEVFLKIYENIDRYDENRASISTWIFTVMKNTLTDYYRNRRIIGEIPDNLSEDEDISEEICNAEMLKALAAGLTEIGEYDIRLRDIVILRYYDGLALSDIAERLGVSYSYVKILHNKALSELKKYLQ